MEFLPPRRMSQRVVIICDGLPSMPSKFPVLDMFSRKGFWAFHPRYRGTWESGGTFLERSPHMDVLDVINGLRRPFRDVWSGEEYRLCPATVHVIGASFGGTAALLASSDPRVNGAVALSPVIDWTAESVSEPHAWLRSVIREGYGDAYRFSAARWRALGAGRFFNPLSHIGEMDGEKILMFHAKDDDVVPFRPAQHFAKKTGCTFRPYVRGGHYSASALLRKRMQKHLWDFLKKTS